MASDDSIDRALALCLATAANLARVTSRVRPTGRLLGAIAALSAPTGVDLPLGSAADPLTARQYEVAILIAQGLTNRQIADALVISERTVDTHVQNILGRLELTTRTQVAAWLIERLLRAAGASHLAPPRSSPPPTTYRSPMSTLHCGQPTWARADRLLGRRDDL
jgi:DNA-binding NarL/FixJ family response regulator